MNNFALALLMLMSTSIGLSQKSEFKPSAHFSITGIEYEKRMHFNQFGDWEKDTMIASLVLNSNSQTALKSYKIPGVDTFDSVYVKEWVNPGYENVDRILWVQFEYAACCYDYQVYYYIITRDKRIVELPSVYYSMCDFPSEIEEYEYDPENNAFRRVINMYIGSNNIQESTDVETLFWDGEQLVGPE